jgi:hypothetical protein
MPDDTPMVRVICPRCGRSEIAPAGNPDEPWLPKVAPDGQFMLVAHTSAAGDEAVGVYCRACWSDILACIVKSMLPATIREPVTTRNEEPAVADNESAEVVN